MAPKRGAATHAAAPAAPAKKVKHSTPAPMSPVAEMLTAILPFSLAVPKADRHAYQHEAVEMMGQELCRREAALVQSMEEAEAAAAGLEEQCSAKEAVIEEKRRAIEVKEGITTEKKHALAEVSTVFKTAKATLEASQTESRKGIAALDVATTKNAALEAALLQMPTLHGTPDEIPAFVDMLSGHVQIDDSLLTAAPAAFSKAEDAQGPFDKMAVNQIIEVVNRRMAQLQESMAGSEAAKAGFASAEASATSSQEAARERLRTSADAYSAAFEEETSCKDDLKCEQKTLKEFRSKLRLAAATSAERSDALAGFRSGPLAAFRELAERGTGAEEAEAEMPQLKLLQTEVLAWG